MLYKGYVETKGKASIEKLKNRTTWKTYDEVKNLNGFGGVLADDTILIDIDDSDQSEILMNIVEELQLDCKVLCTSTVIWMIFVFLQEPKKNCISYLQKSMNISYRI